MLNLWIKINNTREKINNGILGYAAHVNGLLQACDPIAPIINIFVWHSLLLSFHWHFLLFSFSPGTSLYCTLFITNSTFIQLFIPIFCFLFHFYSYFHPWLEGLCPHLFVHIILTYKGGDASSSWLTPTTCFPMSYEHTQKKWFWSIQIKHILNNR